MGEIVELRSLGRDLIILATNGVWALSGGSDYGFSADNYQVTKVSKLAVLGRGSVVEVQGGLFFWSEDGIYQLSRNEAGQWGVQNITRSTIQTFFTSIPSTANTSVQAGYDAVEGVVRWMYDREGTANGHALRQELILDTALGAFYVFDVSPAGSNYQAIPYGYVKSQPFNNRAVSSDVAVNGDIAEADGATVVVEDEVRELRLRELKQLVFHSQGVGNDLTYTFGFYQNEDFADWYSLDNAGVDAAGYILTGEITAGDGSRQKQVPYITTYMRKTESFLNQEYEFDNPSSLTVQARWDFSDSASGNKWSKAFEAYRIRRHYIPPGVGFPLDNGFYLVVSKNKLRGRGRAFSLYMTTSPGKDCRLVGWSLALQGNSVV